MPLHKPSRIVKRVQFEYPILSNLPGRQASELRLGLTLERQLFLPNVPLERDGSPLPDDTAKLQIEAHLQAHASKDFQLRKHLTVYTLPEDVLTANLPGTLLTRTHKNAFIITQPKHIKMRKVLGFKSLGIQFMLSHYGYPKIVLDKRCNKASLEAAITKPLYDENNSRLFLLSCLLQHDFALLQTLLQESCPDFKVEDILTHAITSQHPLTAGQDTLKFLPVDSLSAEALLLASVLLKQSACPWAQMEAEIAVKEYQSKARLTGKQVLKYRKARSKQARLSERLNGYTESLVKYIALLKQHDRLKDLIEYAKSQVPQASNNKETTILGKAVESPRSVMLRFFAFLADTVNLHSEQLATFEQEEIDVLMAIQGISTSEQQALLAFKQHERKTQWQDALKERGLATSESPSPQQGASLIHSGLPDALFIEAPQLDLEVEPSFDGFTEAAPFQNTFFSPEPDSNFNTEDFFNFPPEEEDNGAEQESKRQKTYNMIDSDDDDSIILPLSPGWH